MTGKIVGIDLGTTNSVVSIVEGGAPIVIPGAEGDYLFPSVVGFSKSGERLVGSVAKRQAISNPERTVISIKRNMGTDQRTQIDARQAILEAQSLMDRICYQDLQLETPFEVLQFLREEVEQEVPAEPAPLTAAPAARTQAGMGLQGAAG